MYIEKIAEAEYENTLTLLRELCAIPAPSGHEEKRARFCLDFFKKLGADKAYIDESKNAVCEIGCENEETVMFCAHTDTVFPDTEPLPYSEDEKNIYCAGSGDDTACLAVMMSVLKFLCDSGIKPDKHIIFVANSCEEGLGNLKGSRQIFRDFPDIKRMYTFDGMYDAIVGKSVGSHRYKVTVKTEGGHSFNHFGNTNAIAIMSEIIGKIYCIEVPKKEGTKTTYNVGTIEGGTSVNTIAQEACCLVEYRSDDAECLDFIKDKFHEIFDCVKDKCSELSVELVGDRPGAKGLDESAQKELCRHVTDIQNKYTGLETAVNSGSTDCNIPHSLGIPAVCCGIYMGGGMHKREEWVEKESLKTGLCIALELVLSECGVL